MGKPMPIGLDELRNRSKKPRTVVAPPQNPRLAQNQGAKKVSPKPAPKVGGRGISAQKSPYRPSKGMSR